MHFPRQPFRIESGQQVVLHEATFITRLRPPGPERVLQGREGADAAAELDPRPPQRCRQVQPGGLGPAQGQQPAQHDEGDEGQVQNDDAVGEEAVDHEGESPGALFIVVS